MLFFRFVRSKPLLAPLVDRVLIFTFYKQLL